jgi:hypothetical protein
MTPTFQTIQIYLEKSERNQELVGMLIIPIKISANWEMIKIDAGKKQIEKSFSKHKIKLEDI